MRKVKKSIDKKITSRDNSLIKSRQEAEKRRKLAKKLPG
jgi:hypothetical protein